MKLTPQQRKSVQGCATRIFASALLDRLSANKWPSGGAIDIRETQAARDLALMRWSVVAFQSPSDDRGVLAELYFGGLIIELHAKSAARKRTAA